eukprot:1160741-Pyramimonas_sp.AAC.2
MYHRRGSRRHTCGGPDGNEGMETDVQVRECPVSTPPILTPDPVSFPVPPTPPSSPRLGAARDSSPPA